MDLQCISTNVLCDFIKKTCDAKHFTKKQFFEVIHALYGEKLNFKNTTMYSLVLRYETLKIASQEYGIEATLLHLELMKRLSCSGAFIKGMFPNIKYAQIAGYTEDQQAIQLRLSIDCMSTNVDWFNVGPKIEVLSRYNHVIDSSSMPEPIKNGLNLLVETHYERHLRKPTMLPDYPTAI